MNRKNTGSSQIVFSAPEISYGPIYGLPVNFSLTSFKRKHSCLALIMINKKMKYDELLNKFPNCPALHYQEVSRPSFRWIIGEKHVNNFIPINLISAPPPKMLDESDKMCMGYGLSFFDSFSNAFEKYKSLYSRKREHQREQFREDKGTIIATITIKNDDGIADEPNYNNYGHFTFHEYHATDLNHKIEQITSIFESYGKTLNKAI
jgi:hypothetical protein